MIRIDSREDILPFSLAVQEIVRGGNSVNQNLLELAVGSSPENVSLSISVLNGDISHWGDVTVLI